MTPHERAQSRYYLANRDSLRSSQRAEYAALKQDPLPYAARLHKVATAGTLRYKRRYLHALRARFPA
jgi:hypothetical protein